MLKDETHHTNRRFSNKKSFLVFGSPAIGQPEIDEVVSCMHSGWLGTGPKVAMLERSFADYKGVESAIAVNSCTAALHLSVLTSGIGPGDEVITTPMTFCATVNSIIYTGATPVLVDIDPETMNIDPDKIERKVTKRTKAILPVHFAGRPCDMDRICEIASKHDLVIIEDCAHAVETEIKGRKAGTFGDYGCFSFYATKNVAAGEGGMVLARNEKDAERIRVMALHGLSAGAWKRFGCEGFKHYHVVDCGYKYNMMDLQAAIAIHQLARVDENWLRRKQIWDMYQNAFSSRPISLPSTVDSDTRHAYHLFTVGIDERLTGIDRDSFVEEMTNRGIGVGIHYLSIPEHAYYRRRYNWEPQDFPNALRNGRQTVSLPLSPGMSDDDAARVVGCVGEILDKYS
jgi:dTDP-4-amino-4,6-dideoxygalactose transaminase